MIMNNACTNNASPFHKGEQEIQSKLGLREQMENQGRRVIRDYLPEQHRDFYRQLAYILVGSVDRAGRPWASIVAGEPGFIASPDAQTLSISAKPLAGDPLNEALMAGSDLGLLGIDLNKRRRNRINGKVSATSPSAFDVSVTQTFGNCPQYIQTRDYSVRDVTGHKETEAVHSRIFDTKDVNLITNADTFFIATHYADEQEQSSSGIDVSHRGGKPGFVHIDNERSITWPDFSGNQHFNTIGNIFLNPRIGMLFIDFASGDLLYLTGSANIIWDGPELEAFEGAERLVQITVDELIRLDAALPLTLSLKDYSPSLKRTGAWP
jgi:uncharacterized protein